MNDTTIPVGVKQCDLRRSLTLIEMLAVIVISSLAVTVVSVSLASADRGAQVLKTVATVREMDVRGRMHARTSGEIAVLRCDAESNTLHLRSRSGETLAVHSVDQDLRVLIQMVPRDGDEVVFDRQGRSEDYRFAVHSEGLTQRWHIAGLTGIAQMERMP